MASLQGFATLGDGLRPPVKYSKYLLSDKLPSIYQTNPYPSRHSKKLFLRHILVMLSILRTLPMVRFAIIAFLLAALITVPAGATPTRTHRAHRNSALRVHHQRLRHVASRTAPRAQRHTAGHSARHVARYPAARRRNRYHPRTITYHQAQARLISVAGTRRPEIADADTRPPAPQAFKAPTPAAERTIVPVPVTPAPIPLQKTTRIIALAPLRGSLESLERQNEKTQADGLERILDDNDLNDRIARGMLVPVPVSSGLMVNPELPQNRRYCRLWTATFLTDLARAHDARFHTPLDVSSAVRTVEYQKRLMEINGNAAQAEGDIASPHLTGATIDIAKQGLSRQEIYWMRDRLNSLQDAGKIDVEEEFHQSCFHITVYKSYIGAGPAHKPLRRATIPPVPGNTEPPTPTPVASGGL